MAKSKILRRSLRVCPKGRPAGVSFIEAGARQFFPQPYKFTGVELQYFCVEGTWEKLEQLCSELKTLIQAGETQRFAES